MEGTGVIDTRGCNDAHLRGPLVLGDALGQLLEGNSRDWVTIGARIAPGPGQAGSASSRARTSPVYWFSSDARRFTISSNLPTLTAAWISALGALLDSCGDDILGNKWSGVAVGRT